jgi:hypothetical protein
MKVKQKYQLLLGAGLALCLIIFVGVAVVIYSFKDTRLRYTIDGLVVDGPVWELRLAVASGDSGNISRAFSKATFRPVWKMKEAIPTMQGYLSNTNPYVRYRAAEALYKFGEQSGYSTLLGLVQSPGPVLGVGEDLRIQATTTLAQYRQTNAVNLISDLYLRTQNDEVSQVLANMGVQLPGIDQLPFVESDLAIAEYAKTGITRFLPQITDVFHNSHKPKVKDAAAWALATMTDDQNAIDFLVQTAQEGLTESDRARYIDERVIIMYLGTIQTSAAKQTLEAALNSSDSGIVEVATVNLLYNQGGSEKAKGVLAEALNLKRMDLDWDFVLRVASQFKNDPKIKEAGEHFAKNDITESWQLWTGDRQNWPIYNWIDGAVIKLNPKTPVHP